MRRQRANDRRGRCPTGDVYRGKKSLRGKRSSNPDIEFQAIYFGEAKPGTKFLLYGASQPKPEWGTPIEMSAALEKYLEVVLALPADRGERAIKMQKYILDADAMVRQDAYNEFATTEYKDLQRVAKQFDVKQIRSQLANLDQRRYAHRAQLHAARHLRRAGRSADARGALALQRTTTTANG